MVLIGYIYLDFPRFWFFFYILSTYSINMPTTDDVIINPPTADYIITDPPTTYDDLKEILPVDSACRILDFPAMDLPAKISDRGQKEILAEDSA